MGLPYLWGWAIINQMPKGIYRHKPLAERDPVVAERIRECLEAGRTPEVRKQVAKLLKTNAADPEWRAMVSSQTQVAMRSPAIRRRHLAGLKQARQKHGVNFRGGNGSPPVPKVIELALKLKPLGFIMEFPIKTKGHGTGLNAATAYKVDFGHPIRKVAVEVDGPIHRSKANQAKDKKKTAVLNALGWTVARVKHLK